MLRSIPLSCSCHLGQRKLFIGFLSHKSIYKCIRVIHRKDSSCPNKRMNTDISSYLAKEENLVLLQRDYHIHSI